MTVVRWFAVPARRQVILWMLAIFVGAPVSRPVPCLTEWERTLQCFGLRKTLLICMRFELHE
jgi:hypothetical protein